MAMNRTRLVVAGAATLLLAALLGVTASALLAEYGSPERIEQAIGREPANALLWRRAARASALSLSDEELHRGVERYRQALARNPLDAPSWEGLATLETRLGGDKSAEPALRGWNAAIPNSPRAAWTLANLLLRQERREQALPYFRRAATHDASLRPTLFILAWNILDDSLKIWREVIPPDDAARIDYFHYLLMERADLKAAGAVWPELRAAQTFRVSEMGMLFAERLAVAGQGPQAAAIWRQVAPAARQEPAGGNSSSAEPLASGERMTNGAFEQPLLNAGLDWRVLKAPGYHALLDDFTRADGARSLRLEFNGAANPEFAELLQWIVVEPNRDYRFRASIKTGNLNTDSGVYWSLSNATQAPVSPRSWITGEQIGSNPWTVQEMDIRTDPDTTVLLLQLKRRASAKPGVLLQGTVWVDGVSLTPR